MKIVRTIIYVVLGLAIFLFVLNGAVDSIDLKFMTVKFKAASMEHLCFPMWKRDTPKQTDISLSKATANVGDRLGDWHIEGADGLGGTLLSYKFSADGTITNVAPIACSGCGGHTWQCPAPGGKEEPRCGAHHAVDHAPQGDWIAYIATDGAPATTAIYRVSFTQTKAVCWF